MAQILPLIIISHFELVLKRIYDILVLEEINQEFQATNLSLNPEDYSWKNTLEVFLPIQALNSLHIPIVNIWFSSSDYKRNDNHVTYINNVTFNIDVYCKAATSSNGSTQGLTNASMILNRVIRQVKAILMSPKYVTLGFPRKDNLGKPINFIEKRWISSVLKFQPEQALNAVENVIAARIEFIVGISEKIYDLIGDPVDSFLANINAPTGINNDGVLIDGGS